MPHVDHHPYSYDEITFQLMALLSENLLFGLQKNPLFDTYISEPNTRTPGEVTVESVLFISIHIMEIYNV